jgi:dihydrofolate synthase / folylpolyglutamate synthase
VIKLGLDRVRRALSRLGHPENEFASVLIAGTNGKGSVSSLVASASRAAGLKVGHYTSPHLVDIRERVRVNGRKIGPEDWTSLSRRVQNLRLGLTEFERQTLAAFLHFAAVGVDVAVVEVGLGGRLDATNALPAPEATAITSIGHDHRSWLGPTLRHVYFEKRGIARPGTPMAQSAPRALWAAGDREYREKGVPAWTLGREILMTPGRTDWRRRVQTLDVSLPGAVYKGIEVSLLGAHQAENAAVALSVCHSLRRRGWPLDEGSIRAGFAAARWPGRFQVIEGAPDVILDGAHNREAAEALAAAYRGSPWGKKPATLVFGCLKDKDAAAMARVLRLLAGRVILTPLPTDRSRSTGELKPLWRGCDTREAVSAAAAVRLARTFKEPILVTGSLYLVGEAMTVFRRIPS